MNIRLWVVLIISIFPVSYAAGEVYTAELLSPPSIDLRVGIPAVVEYKIPFTEEFLSSLAFMEETSDDVILNLLHVSVLSNDTGIEALQLWVEILPVVSGVLYIPDMYSANHRIHFPYLHVKSSLDKNDLSLQPIHYYTPWIEIVEVALYSIILVFFLVYMLFVLVKIHTHFASTKYVLSNFLNLKICTRKIEKLVTTLKKMGNNKTRKYIVSIDCYTILWNVVHKRLGYFVDKQTIDSFTGDEIAAFILLYSDQRLLSTAQIHAFFTTIDEVLYGHKQFSIERRIKDCLLLKQILLNTFRFKLDKSKKFTELDVLHEKSKNAHVFDTNAM